MRNPKTIKLHADVELTTASTASHYGIPAARITGCPYDLGPGDIIPTWADVKRQTGLDDLPLALRAFSGTSAATLVANLARTVGNESVPGQNHLPKLTEADVRAIQEYLGQQPGGWRIDRDNGRVVATTPQGHRF